MDICKIIRNTLLLMIVIILIYTYETLQPHCIHMSETEGTSAMEPVEVPVPTECQPNENLRPRVPLTLDAIYPNSLLDEDLPAYAKVLNSSSVPNIVYYVWCRDQYFDFRHYLSVLSVIRTMRPDNIFFYYKDLPKIENKHYYTWFDELRDMYPTFAVLPPSFGVPMCNTSTGEVNKNFMLKAMQRSGGIYVNETVILNTVPLNLRYPGTTTGHPHFKDIFSFKSKGGDTNDISTWKAGIENVGCRSPESFTLEDHCVKLENEIYPENIWTGESAINQIARRIFYGKSDTIRPLRSSADLAPNIAHLVWMGHKPMSFKFYLSVLSLIYVGKVDDVYIHNNNSMHGKYWDKISNHPKVHVIYRHRESNRLYRNRIWMVQHWSDALRLDILIKYGGLYIDTDAVLVQPLTEEIRSYEAVISMDFPPRPPYPNSLSNGAMLGKTNAEFFRRFLLSFKWLEEGIFFWNGIFQSYKILERHPHLVLVEPRLEVQCSFAEGYCHPTWMKGFRSLSVHHMNSDSLKNWRTDAFVYHLGIFPPAMETEDYCREPIEINSEICNYILTQAGVL